MHPEEQKIPDSNENLELESQFILRLPSLPAASLRAAVRSGVLNLKERLSIQIDQDMRNGLVRFDGWVLPAKIVDLPTILESHKTLDNKNFYKTADISQMMICKEETDETKDETEEVSKKTKDGRDKKYLYPHGITKPLKNVRKRRFRKTMKKYVDFPEIEKEVKRLLRQDNEAKHVRFEIVKEEFKNDSKEKDSSVQMGNENNSAYDVGDLFGDVVSSSDDEDEERVGAFSDEGSRMSNTFRDYLKEQGEEEKVYSNKVQFTTFSQALEADNLATVSSNDGNFDYTTAETDENNEASFSITKNMENEAVKLRLQELETEIQHLQTKCLAQQMQLDSIDNMALKQRFQDAIDDLKAREMMKKKEYEDLKKQL